ncbi:probable cysteine--tRNA ligase, mitochondrial isoform X2 [Salvelinus fontinalis]|uniref:probable cysteine--tRNA ligase, mitochondrial isoform X2 n=1 Tax=Salvelinus fontinalis TaxID=8038 RepID=UPI002485AF80|nr:probable cysteine--tRNA ligase, mitochondrial isoform X2 [Salvelinus fontinalis]
MWPCITIFRPLLLKLRCRYAFSKDIQLTLVSPSKLIFRPSASCTGVGKKWTRPTGYDTGLKTYNSLTKQKEPLVLAKEGIATWYSCGPTVYDHAHLGHACSYVRFDIIQRVLSRVFGINVIHVMVITDIDDKIIRRALEVLPPAVYLRVTENIPQIVAFIEGIIRNEHAYATKQGDVYFDIGSIGDRYGKLMGARDAAGEPGDTEKRDSRDFALWKASKPQEPSWESPWGKGRPGWHIECSTIASSVFGSQLDIHSGGVDLAFPHHENEIAQCEAYHQCGQWGNYFLHSGHLHLKGSAEKMSKSLNNYISIKDFLESYSANEFRMFCLLTKYRSAIDYSDASLNEAQSSLATITAFTHDAQAYMRGQLQCQAVQEGALWERLAETKANVVRALADDFDTPRVVNAIMSLVYHGNRHLQPVTKPDSSPRSPAVFGAFLTYIREVFDVLGVDLLDRKEAHSVDSSGTLENVVEQLARFRSDVRAFALSVEDTLPGEPAYASPRQRSEKLPLLKACDTLRKDLASMGVHIRDRGPNSTWEISQKRPAGQDKK